MLYLGTSPSEPDVRAVLDSRRVGLMCQPWGSRYPQPGWLWAADNGCFAPDKWKAQLWTDWLWSHRSRSGCLFATVPDVVADHEATLARFFEFRPIVAEAGYPVAFVAQNGATVETIPWDFLDCLFIGGDTYWKMGVAFGLVEAAHERGKWLHVGRVNSNRRYRAWEPFADSCDGTLLAFGPKTNMPRILDWLGNAEREPTIWGGAVSKEDE